MRNILITLCVLLLLLAGMSSLYFSGLDTSNIKSELSLQMASRNATMIFSIQNNKSSIDLLKSQDLFNNLIGKDKVAILDALKSKLVAKDAVNSLINDQNVYISVFPGTAKNLEMLLTVQLNSAANREILLNAFRSSNVNFTQQNGNYTIALSDSLSVYLGIDKNVLVLSTSAQLLTATLNNKPDRDENQFTDFIRKNDRLSRNSLASLYINYNKIPALLKAITPYASSSLFSVLNRQDGFSHLSYNFSKEKIFFSGETTVNHASSYDALFADLEPEKIVLDKVLPSSTATYTLYSVGNYANWHKTLVQWFSKRKEQGKIENRIENINATYRLNLNHTFPKYVGSQFVTFQCKNQEKLGAIGLLNGDKLSQLLLDLSDAYAGDIKLIKEPDIFYYYFGEPLKDFKRPYYVILNNVMFLSNTPAALVTLLSRYNENDLLIKEPAYTRIFEQLPNQTNILYYVNNAQSQPLTIKTIYPSYYSHFRDPEGLKYFDSFILQLSGDQGSFQTNMMLNTKKRETKSTF